MEKIYHYAISLHTESPPNTNLIKAHEKGAVYLGADFKPTIHENHLMISTHAIAEKIIEKIKPAIAEKYGKTATMQIIYDSVQANDKQKGRKAEHDPIISAFLE